MRFEHTPRPLFLIAGLLACTGKSELVEPEIGPAPVADPMASFARLVAGEWRVTFPGGTSQYETWHWGPGKHSLRAMTHGDEAAGKPWRALGVFYWHPGRQQVCSLSLNPFERSVAEGTVLFEDDSFETVVDLYQTGVRREIVRHTAFEGPDSLHVTLLEATDAAGLVPLVEWDYVRSEVLTPARPLSAHEVPEFPERLRAVEPLHGQTFETTGEAEGEWGAGAAALVQSTIEWIPFADGIYARVLAAGKDREPTHLLDAYVFHHTGTGALRCLALSHWGGVYEGELVVLEGGALQLDLTGYENEQVVPHVVRFDFARDGILRQRVWSVSGTERTLLLDVQHEKLEPKTD
jgi:hypothetical protein